MPYHVYMMANRWNTVLYIGMTDELARRAWEHRTGYYPEAFTWTYQCLKLVWIEEHEDGVSAATRERQMKEWKREWKEKLVKEMNPTWQDIAPAYEPPTE